MNHMSWLETLALHTEHHIEASKILEKQSTDIQAAYANNDQGALRVLFSKGEQLAYRTTVFEI